MTRSLVAAVLLLALVVRVVEVESTSYRPKSDAAFYLALASEVAHLGGYSSHDPGAGGTRGPSAYWPPGYPYLLGAVDLLGGHKTRLGAAVHPARLSQTVLGTVTVALVGLVAVELLDSTVALIALALAAIYPVLVVDSGLIIAENLMVALILGAVWAVLRSRHSGRPLVWICGAGILTGLATLTHQNSFLILIPLLVAVWQGRPARPARALLAPAVLVAAAVLTIVPWTIRNAVELHAFIPVSDEAGITLRGAYNPTSAAFRPLPYKWHLFINVAQDRALAASASGLTEPQLGSKLFSRAVHYIGDHPLSPLDVALRNSLRLFDLEGSFAWRASARAQRIPLGLATVNVLSVWLICLLALAGAFTRRARAAPRWFWSIPVLLALSIVCINVETPRFREPIEPFLVLLAACALAALGERLVGRAPIGRRLKTTTARG